MAALQAHDKPRYRGLNGRRIFLPGKIGTKLPKSDESIIPVEFVLV